MRLSVSAGTAGAGAVAVLLGVVRARNRAAISSTPDGEAMDLSWWQRLLRSHARLSAVELESASAGTHHVAHVIRVTTDSGDVARYYCKRMFPHELPTRTAERWRADITSYRNEVSFYAAGGAGDKLREAGVLVCRAHYSSSTGDIPVDSASNIDALLRCRSMLLLEFTPLPQHSPHGAARARAAMRFLASLHSAGTALLRTGGGDQPSDVGRGNNCFSLHARGGYWSLHHRGEHELTQMPSVWADFTRQWLQSGGDGPLCKLLRGPRREQLLALGARLFRHARWVDEQIGRAASAAGSPTATSTTRTTAPGCTRTLIHGDFKALNIFFDDGSGSVGGGDDDDAARGDEAPCNVHRVIDWQWAGVGIGLSDVAQHLWHSVAVDAIDEEGLLRHYADEYYRLNDHDSTSSRQHDFEHCVRHYKLCVLDFARMVVARFLAGASPRTFRQKANMPNVGLCYRSERCCALFVSRVDDLLTELDRDDDLSTTLSRLHVPDG